MTEHTSPDFDQLRDELAGDSFAPCDGFVFDGLDRKIAATIEYFELRGWDAVRSNGDSLTFVRFSDEGCKLMTTTPSGVISTEASFTNDRLGLRMFTMAASLRP